MNPLKTLQNLCSTVLTVLFLSWFGISAFKLGFYAREIPLLESVVGFLLEEKKPLESKPNSSVVKTIQNLLLQTSPEQQSKPQD